MKWSWRVQVLWGVMTLIGVAIAARLTHDDRQGVQCIGESHRLYSERNGAIHRYSKSVPVSGTALAAGGVVNVAKRDVADLAHWDDTSATFPRAVKLVFAPDQAGSSASLRSVQLCQFCSPRTLYGVDCQSWCDPCREPGWDAAHPLPFETYGQGEYLGPARTPHVACYTIRVNDQLDFVYRFTHQEIPEAYRLMVGDEIMVETFPQDEGKDFIRRPGLQVQPDGTIVLPYANTIRVVGRTIKEIRDEIEAKLTTPPTGPYNKGAIEVVVTPLKTNSALEDLRSAVDARYGSGGQTRTATVTPEGTVQLVGIGSVPAQGLTIQELETEINARYVNIFGPGVQVSTILRQFAPRFVWVAGEVVQPGQYQVNQPLTVVQAIALAHGFNNGGNVREIVVFRRDDDWHLMATRLDVRGVFVGKTPFPSDDIWLRDNDVVVVPKGPIQRVDEFINLVFTRGILSCLPFQGNIAVKF